MKGFLKHRRDAAASDAAPGAAESPYVFGSAGGCQVWVAASAAQRARAWALVYGVYLAKGYAAVDPQRLWYGLHDALPETATFLAERDGQAVAAFSVVPDSPLGLPADAAFGPELAALRRPGRRLCELHNLASVDSEIHRGAETLNHLFKLAFLVARRLEQATDFVIRVSPQHRPFYRRLLLFRDAGAERAGGGPGTSPGMLMALDLETAESRYRRKYGAGPESFYGFFVDPGTEPGILAWLKAGRRPLDEAALRRFFIADRPLVPGASEAARRCLQERYPGCNLGG
jgi:hypothetical protein